MGLDLCLQSSLSFTDFGLEFASVIVKPTTQLHPNTAFTYINVNIYCMEREKGREREKVRVSESTFGRGRGRRRNNREWKD